MTVTMGTPTDTSRRRQAGLGTAALSRATVSDEVAVATVGRALDLGLLLLDTAPHYGAGRAEVLVGKAIAGRDRRSFRISTKIGRVLCDDHGRLVSTPDLGYDAAWRTLDGSLTRLGVDRIDVLHVHDPMDHGEALSGAFRAAAQMRDQGLISDIGCGMMHSAPLTAFVRELDLDCVMIAGAITLLDDDADELLSVCQDRGVDVWAAAVFATGVLVDPERGSYRYRPAPEHVRSRARRLREITESFGMPLVAAAAQFPLRHDAVTSVVFGAVTPAEVETMMTALEADVPDELWKALAREVAEPSRANAVIEGPPR